MTSEGEIKQIGIYFTPEEWLATARILSTVFGQGVDLLSDADLRWAGTAAGQIHSNVEHPTSTRYTLPRRK